MPIFLCPCCGGSYLVPLAFCEVVLDAREWKGGVAPARCIHCQDALTVGASVIVRGGFGITEEGTAVQLVEGQAATIIDVATWDDHGTIFLVQLAGDQQVYVSRAALTTHKLEGGYYLNPP